MNSGITPCILNVDTRRRKMVSFRLRPFHPQGKKPRYPFDRRLDVAQGQSGREKSTPLPGTDVRSSSL